jgi:integrase
MLQLPNGCSCSNPTVYPPNWKTGGQSLLKKDWYIQYRFYDPLFKNKYPRGRLKIVKGMNSFKDLCERREAVNILLADELQALRYQQYNPITGVVVEQVEDIAISYEIDPQMPFVDALKAALKYVDVKSQTKIDITSVLKYVGLAARNLRYDHIPISEIKKKNIKILLAEVGKIDIIDAKGNRIQRNFSDKRYNVYWKHLHRLFQELIELEACEYNPVKLIKKKSTVTKMRLTLTKEERHTSINEHLKEKFYSFFRFCQIFFHSGSRMTELLRVKVKDVDLYRQSFKMIVEKGKNKREEERTIKDIALPFWIELLQDAKPDDYIFAKGLLPGSVPITAPQITRRWRMHVKDKLGIKADLYSLKHSNLDETAGLLDEIAAQNQAGHTTPVITIKNYLHGQKEREHQRLKSVNNEL